VELWLECEHGRVNLAQVGPSFVIAAQPTDIPECEADVVVCIDGRQHVRRVHLAGGMKASVSKATALAVDSLPF